METSVKVCVHESGFGGLSVHHATWAEEGMEYFIEYSSPNGDNDCKVFHLTRQDMIALQGAIGALLDMVKG